MKIEFVSSVAVIAPDPPQSHRLYLDTLGLPLTSASADGYFHSEQIQGTKHFGVWPLSQAAEAHRLSESRHFRGKLVFQVRLNT